MFATQLVAVEQVIPKSRPFSGWISEHSTQISGPAKAWNSAKSAANRSPKPGVKQCQACGCALAASGIKIHKATDMQDIIAEDQKTASYVDFSLP
jgi:hypothetical protein